MVEMLVFGLSVAALGACFHRYTVSDCSVNNRERCVPYYGVNHQNNVNDTLRAQCPAAQTLLTFNPPFPRYELFSNYINQQSTADLANAGEQDCKGSNDCICFNNSEINTLLEASIMLETKADLTYQTVAAACPLISTTDPQIIINAALKEIDVIGVVTGKEYTPVGTYGFACESDPSTFFLLKENRMLAQVKQTNANNQPFQQGIFRSVALSNIEACKCSGEEIVELVVRPATNKAKENTIGTNDVWFDTSVCRSNLRDCLIEEMERPCSACAAGQTEVKPCGLFYDTVCRGAAHVKSDTGEKANVDQTAGIIMLCLFIGIALLVFMSASVEHEAKKASGSKQKKPKANETQKLLSTGF